MKFKRGLRHRIIFSFVIFGTLLTTFIGLGVHWAVEDLEKELLEENLRLELEYFLNRVEHTPGMIEQVSAYSLLYYVDESRKGLVPDEMRDLPEGTHEVHFKSNTTYFVLVSHDDNGTIYLAHNATPFEQRELAIQLTIFAVILVAALIALWLGMWLSGKIIKPVTTLAEQVSRLKPGEQKCDKVASRYADDEVGQLAEVFDSYLCKMEEFIKREQEFSADASHELRTPLAIIKGATELLTETPDLSPQSRKQIERIARAIERMSQMLEVLLILARDATANGNTQEPCLVGEIAASIVDQHRSMAEEKGIKLQIGIKSDFQLPVSRTTLNMVLSNLVRNAINYTKTGEVIIRVSDKQVSISDTGIGISAEDLEHIFERNYRGQNVKNAGSGIGLSIVKRICDRHKWDIDIQSREDQGTTIKLNF